MSDTVEPVSAPSGSRFLRTFSVFRHRDFRLLWLGAFTSTTGTWMQQVAQAWIVLSLTGSAFFLGVDTFLATLPMILFSLVGGVFADRFDRRRLLLGSQVGQMITAIVLALLIYFDVVEVWMIFALSFVTGSVQSFGGPAYQALLPALVKREEIQKAIALNSTQFNLARMIGPVLAGLALSSLGAVWCFGLNAASFIPVILFLLVIRAGGYKPNPAQQRKSVFAEMGDGLRFVRRESAILQLTFLAFAGTFFGVPISVLLPVVAKKIYSLDASGYGWMLTTYAAGSLVGALMFAGAAEIRRRGMLTIASMLVFSASLLMFALSTSFVVSMIALFICGGTLIGVITTVSSLVQLATSEEMRGRVMSIFMLAFRGGMPLGSLFSGWVADQYGVGRALTINAIGLAIVGLIYLLGKTRVRDL